jgi:hypothetical protein
LDRVSIVYNEISYSRISVVSLLFSLIYQDSKEHLFALADKLGPSLKDIDLIKPSAAPTDPSEQGKSQVRNSIMHIFIVSSPNPVYNNSLFSALSGSSSFCSIPNHIK